MACGTPAALALVNAILLSVVAAGAARPSKSLRKSNESEEQVRSLECDRSHVL